jgi:hypothetical protein
MKFIHRAAWVLAILAVTALILIALEAEPTERAEEQKVERKS